LHGGEHGRDAIHNTIGKPRDEEDDGLEDDEGLVADPDSDEAAAIAFYKKIDPRILLNGIGHEPNQLYDPDLDLSRVTLVVSDPLDGMWTGKILLPDGTVHLGTLSMQLRRTACNLTGMGETYLGLLNVAGTVAGDNSVRLTITWPALSSAYLVVCTGAYDSAEDTITGIWVAKMKDSQGERDLDYTSANNEDQASNGALNDSSTSFKNSMHFVFRRPSSYTDGARARWNVAIATVINMGKPIAPRKATPLRSARAQTRWLWIVEHLAERKRFIDLVKREMADFRNLSTPLESLSHDQFVELQRLKTELRPCDARVYALLAKSQLEQLVNQYVFIVHVGNAKSE
jgi:hypothetical protein